MVILTSRLEDFEFENSTTAARTERQLARSVIIIEFDHYKKLLVLPILILTRKDMNQIDFFAQSQPFTSLLPVNSSKSTNCGFADWGTSNGRDLLKIILG
jgi:hypothetical protein